MIRREEERKLDSEGVLENAFEQGSFDSIFISCEKRSVALSYNNIQKRRICVLQQKMARLIERMKRIGINCFTSRGEGCV